MSALRLLPHPDDEDDDLVLPEEQVDAFHQYLDDTCIYEGGTIWIGEAAFRPAEVLRDLEPDTYRVLYSTYLDQQREQVISQVTGNFPSPIAFWFHMFNYAGDSEVQRFLYLRDTWEAVIRFLHALVIGEVRDRRISLKPIVSKSFKFEHLFSYSMDRLIRNIETVLQYMSTIDTAFESPTLLGFGLSAQLRVLNQLRNAFSHSQTPPELQARVINENSLEEMIEVFQNLEALASVVIVQHRKMEGLKFTGESHIGVTAAPRRYSVMLNSQTIAESYGHSPHYFQSTHLLVHWNGRFICLAPFFHYRQIPERHTTQLCLLKQEKSDSGAKVLEFEVLGESNTFALSSSDFAEHLQDLNSLFVSEGGS